MKNSFLKEENDTYRKAAFTMLSRGRSLRESPVKRTCRLNGTGHAVLAWLGTGFIRSISAEVATSVLYGGRERLRLRSKVLMVSDETWSRFFR